MTEEEMFTEALELIKSIDSGAYSLAKDMTMEDYFQSVVEGEEGITSLMAFCLGKGYDIETLEECLGDIRKKYVETKQ